ncbi:hypothetical protein JHN49_19405, partial [Streptomyces sp. MBT57]|nr:hypothetical protein [Streptomyces sp. MBT57]
MTRRVDGPGPVDGVPGRGVLGAAAGMALGFAGWFGGFGAFLGGGPLGDPPDRPGGHRRRTAPGGGDRHCRLPTSESRNSRRPVPRSTRCPANQPANP